VNNHAHVVKCKNGYPEEYLCYYINLIDLSPYVSGSAQPKLNQKNMNEIPVPIPGKNEQHEIIRRVETLFALADRIEARYQAISERIDKLTQSLLAKAFRGELVPQDPNDEPASVLLERIRAQRATEPSSKAGRRKRESTSA
jgi:type I restriction enzyme S subunit